MLVTVGIADDLDAVAVLGEAVDERDDAGGAGEGVAPLLEREIRRDDRNGEILDAATFPPIGSTVRTRRDQAAINNRCIEPSTNDGSRAQDTTRRSRSARNQRYVCPRRPTGLSNPRTL